jgi:hypothetical protein
VQQPLSKQRQGPVLLLLLQLESGVVVALLAVAATAVNPSSATVAEPATIRPAVC